MVMWGVTRLEGWLGGGMESVSLREAVKEEEEEEEEEEEKAGTSFSGSRLEPQQHPGLALGVLPARTQPGRPGENTSTCLEMSAGFDEAEDTRTRGHGDTRTRGQKDTRKRGHENKRT
ncbi:hypothetical protein E2C01_034674 [Portunus trituberculatus]|uniref:Uncharacterized protein n=1 Tax=Portunus trituberculatus TaxID=210409 RepID=A0A5B7F3E9_PORTR|nr:hypothetical protein [Portunus trituberculatus]